MDNILLNLLKDMAIIDAIKQQIRLGRKETTRLTKKGIEELEKFGTVFAVDNDVKEILEKSYDKI